MQTHRRIALVHLYPIVEFSFSENGPVYKLLKRYSCKRKDRYTIEIKGVKTGQRKKRHFTFDSLRNTFVYLRDNVKTSRQPKTNIVLTVNCVENKAKG